MWSPRRWLLACAALAVLSWATLPTVPSYDPFSWIVWGREVIDPHLAFFVGGGPSWKPLPFGFTVVYALFGSAAPALWVITARIGGLLGWVAAWRLAARLCPGRWGWLAGAIAVGGLLTTQDYGYYFMRGASEPGLVACTLWAIDQLLDGRRGAAFWLLIAASLIRPEWWPYTIALGGWLASRGGPRWESRRGRAAVLAGLVLIPLGWFGPPWLGGGDPLLAARNASLYNGQLGSDPLRAVVGRAVDIQIWPLLAAGCLFVVAAVVAEVRRRPGSRRVRPGIRRVGPGGRRVPPGIWRVGPGSWRVRPGVRRVGRREDDRCDECLWSRRAGVVAGLAGFVGAWWIEVIVMTIWLGYPGLERFFLPAAAVVCVLGGAGMATLAKAVSEGTAGSERTPPRARIAVAAGGALAAVMVAGSILLSPAAVNLLLGAEGQAALAQQTLDGLSRSVAVAGGRSAVLPCPSSFVAVNHSAQPALAWDLRVTLQRVGSAMTRPGVDFIGPADIATGIPAAIDPSLTRDRVVARSGEWTAVALRRGGGGGGCVGR